LARLSSTALASEPLAARSASAARRAGPEKPRASSQKAGAAAKATRARSHRMTSAAAANARTLTAEVTRVTGPDAIAFSTTATSSVSLISRSPSRRSPT